MLTSIRQEDVLATLADLGLLSNWKTQCMVQVDEQELKECVRSRGIRIDRALNVNGFV